MNKKKNTFKAWLVAARLFFIPLLLLPFTFFGIALSDFNLTMWTVTMIITGSVWITGNFINDWRDYALGVDKRNGGSVAKSYTAGSQIIPYGLLSVRAIQLSAVAFLLISLFFLAFFTPLRYDTLLIYCLGVTMALSYTDYLKPHGLGEISVFLTLFSVVSFSYSVISPFDLTGLAAGTIAGIMGAMFSTVDHYPDIQKQGIDKAKNLAEIIFKAEIKLSSMYWFVVTAVFTMHMSFTLLNWLPTLTLLSLFSLPIAHISGIFLDHDIRKGTPLTFLWAACYMTLSGIGALLC